MYETLAARLDQVFGKAKDTLVAKEKVYGDSWKKRGGVGAFMMLARKFDRIELAAAENGWDIFDALELVPGLLDDVQDLRNYLTLIEDEDDKRRESNAEQRTNSDRSEHRSVTANDDEVYSGSDTRGRPTHKNI